MHTGAALPIKRTFEPTLAVLADVYSAARKLWPASTERAASAVTLMLDQLKAASLGGISSAYGEGDCWLVVKHGELSGAVERHPLANLQALLAEKEAALLPFWRDALRLQQPTIKGRRQAQFASPSKGAKPPVVV